MSIAASVENVADGQARGRRFLFILWNEWFIAMLLVALRMCVRLRMTRATSWDDWAMVITMVQVLSISLLSLLIVSSSGHLFTALRHMDALCR